ncbi:hypothetical protein PRZ48_001791 [Zasmidium cellare]|uniref:POPLD-domain-containing protein n=1 Tax=Zasmidium cellare TaxID=395010 RepID=A0ABR0F288_ZASCE|nr:hypothetical protein PRZ48_001791 [Zasmidium cellare]
MAQPNSQAPRPQTGNGQKRRREHPTDAKNGSHKRAKTDHRAKQRDARTLATQTSSKAFRNGELDVDKFVKSREYEIRALEEGMARSKKALTTRAFQHVPKELRRRTASHNVKRVPKRLQPRAKREMIEDNTPTVTARKRKPTRHMRLRLETAKQLRALGAQRKRSQETKSKPNGGKHISELPLAGSNAPSKGQTGLKTRTPKVKSATLASPPVAKAKFRKRQIHKTWLPTHMFHAKRARMTEPKEPLWRFAIPLTPTAKSYRPTHRAANDRGAVAWDTSYISTIGLEGQQRSVEGILKALGLGSELWEARGEKWRNGTRIWEGFALEREAPHRPIAPITVIWCVPESRPAELEKRPRKVFIRVHPSAFWLIWEELVRLAKVAKPQASVQDLRFEIGTIEITGPAATEALQAALWPISCEESPIANGGQSVESLWTALNSLTNPAMLPSDVLLGFEIQDPRLHHPPRKNKLPASERDQDQLLQILASWPFDAAQKAPAIFDRRTRLAASSSLPSQKAINRRRSLAPPGEYPAPCPKDPRIPTLLYHTSERNHSQSTYTLLLPWKCVQPVWYSLMYCPLSTGGQPRFGGLDEKRQLAFENQQPWFPADFPGTEPGWQWEIEERAKREDEWKGRPKSKRTNWESVNLGSGHKGEVGSGLACDWEKLMSLPRSDSISGEKAAHTSEITHLPSLQARNLLSAKANLKSHDNAQRTLATVRIKLLTRGVPETCARIYRLPSAKGSSQLRRRWLTLHPREQASKRRGPKNGLPTLPKDAPAHLVQRRLAQSLLKPPQVGDADYPVCPGEEDLIGFITTGNYNLGEGQGTGIGSLLLGKLLEDDGEDDKESNICIVRNSGNSAGRLAVWEVA